jgi:hypothetical protein
MSHRAVSFFVPSIMFVERQSPDKDGELPGENAPGPGPDVLLECLCARMTANCRAKSYVLSMAKTL